MKDKLFTVAAMATLLGVYSASVYQLSLDRLTIQGSASHIIPTVSIDNREDDKRRILDVVQVREFVTVDSNLPIPGAECEFNIEDVEVNEEQSNEDLSTCFNTIHLK